MTLAYSSCDSLFHDRPSLYYKMGDYSTFDIPTVAEYLSEQLWAKLERQGGGVKNYEKMRRCRLWMVFKDDHQ